MKRLILIVISLCITMLMQAQVSKTVNATAGGLYAALTPAELSTVTNLTLTGTIDSRDFKTMRDNMPVLAVLDLGEVTIAAYQGDDGTRGLSPYGNRYYSANQIPECAFNQNFTRTWGGDKMSYDVGPGKISLTSIILPSSITTLLSYVFSGCTGLTSVTIPSSVTNIPPQAFNSCTALTSVAIPSAETIIGYAAFNNCTALTSVTIPSPVQTIADYAFRNCTSLTSINIPLDVTSLGSWVFYGCRSLSSIYLYGVNPSDLSVAILGDMFFDVNKTTCTLHVPFGTSALYEATNLWKNFTNIVEMPGFRLSKYAVDLAADANSTATVEITTSNVTWAASSNQSWLTVNPTSFTGNSSLTLSTEANSSLAIRSATVTISSPGVDSQTINVTQYGIPKTLEVTAGGLFSALTANELSTINNLIITGTIDARDFKTMRDNMPLLAKLDLSGATVAAYSGTDGTNSGSFNYPADEIPVQAFYNTNTDIGKASLKSFIYPSSAASIGSMAFWKCTGLTAVILPPSFTTIGDNAFRFCTLLTSFSIPSSVTFIGKGAFGDCTGLTSVNIPSSVKTIENSTFGGCTGLTSINIPSSVSYIGDFTFSGCTSLTTCAIPSSVTSIGDNAFWNCSNLTSIYTYRFTPVDLVSSQPVFDGVNKSTCILYIPAGSLDLYKAASQWKDFMNIVEIPVSELSISANAINMASTRSINSVTIFPNVTWSASSNQSWLTPDPISSTVNSTLTLTAETNPSEASRTAVVTVSSPGLVSQTITISQSGQVKTVNIIAGGLFSSLTTNELSIISNLKITGTIDARDFKTMRDNMPLLIELDLSGATIIAYTGTEGTMSGNLNYPANEVSVQAFFNFNTSVAKTGLKSFIFPSSATSIGSMAFMECTGLTSMALPPSLLSIGEYAFSYCNLLTSLAIPSSVTFIGADAFDSCARLTAVNIPSSVKSIEYGTFEYCLSLTSVNIPSSITNIGPDAFYGCTSLTSITPIPSSVTFISFETFSDCSSLTSITIPSSITKIDSKAFKNCSSLTSIYAYPATPVDLSSSEMVFDGVNKSTCILYVPGGSLAFYKAANQWKDFTNIVEIPVSELSISPNTINMASTNTTTSVTITSNVTWSAVSNQSWLTINPTSFTGNSTLTLTAEANSSDASRSAFVSVSSPGLVSKLISISQEGIAKTVNVMPGGLFSALTSYERGTITRLVITGTIDARDFKTMRDEMPLLAELDMSGATIAAYQGQDGTYSRIYTYPANMVPDLSFYFESSIGTGSGKTSLTSVILPSSATSIGRMAFNFCNELISLKIPASVISIGLQAIYNCDNLTSVDIPPSMSIIGYAAFGNCIGLTSITIPKSVTNIGSWAFNFCHNLTSIYALGTTPVDLSSSTNVFYDVNKTTCILHVPYGTSALYAAANQWKDFTNIVEIPVAGSIAASQTICSGITPAPLTSTVAGAGQGTISYRWEYSEDGISWLTTGTSAETYTPGILTQTTMYRRITISTLNGTNWESAPTKPVTIALSNTITLTSAPGTDAQALCTNTPITSITYSTTGASGATFSGLPSGITGTWVSNTVTISGMPSSSGTFKYTVTLTGGCGSVIKTGSIAVIVFPVNPVVISASSNNVDAGSPVTFTASTPVEGGKPSYQWYINNSLASTGAIGTYVPTNGDVVYAQMTTGLACSTKGTATSNAIIMVVNPMVAGVSVVLSENNVCQGTLVTFTAVPVNGGASPTYQWFINNYAVSNNHNGSYVPKNGDVVYVMMKSSNPYATNNPATSNSVTMVVNQNIAANVSISASQNNVCPGTPVTFTANPVGGGTAPTYKWFLNNTAVLTGPCGTYIPKNGDVIYATMTSNNRCTTGNPATSNVVTMAVGTPAALPGYFTEGMAQVTPGLSNVRYTVPNVADVTYIWSYSGTGATISGSSNSVLISFSPTATSGTLSVRTSNSCGTSELRSGNITVGNTLKAGIISDVVEKETIEVPSAKNELKVYPNPASGPVTFEFQINENAKVTIDLLSMTGQRIARIFDADAESAIIHTIIYSEPLPAGVYIYTLRWKDQIIKGKLIMTK